VWTTTIKLVLDWWTDVNGAMMWYRQGCAGRSGARDEAQLLTAEWIWSSRRWDHVGWVATWQVWGSCARVSSSLLMVTVFIARSYSETLLLLPWLNKKQWVISSSIPLLLVLPSFPSYPCFLALTDQSTPCYPSLPQNSLLSPSRRSEVWQSKLVWAPATKAILAYLEPWKGIWWQGVRCFMCIFYQDLLFWTECTIPGATKQNLPAVVTVLLSDS